MKSARLDGKREQREPLSGSQGSLHCGDTDHHGFWSATWLRLRRWMLKQKCINRLGAALASRGSRALISTAVGNSARVMCFEGS